MVSKHFYKFRIFLLVAVFSVFSLMALLSNYVSSVVAMSLDPRDIVSETNFVRAKHGLEPLVVNARLTTSAYAKAYDMFEQQYWDHTAPDGTMIWDFIEESGYEYQITGENLARDFSDAHKVVEAWMNSPEHRANIINPNYKDVGIAVVYGELEGEDTVLIVSVYGRAKDKESKSTNSITSSSPIRIDYPLEGSTVADRRFTMIGTVCCLDLVNSVDVYVNGYNVGREHLDRVLWGYRMDTNRLVDGENIIKVTASDDPEISTNVTFNLDTSPPKFIPGSLRTESILAGLRVTFGIEGAFGDVSVIYNGLVLPAQFVSGNTFEVILPYSQDIDRFMIVASDESGNILSQDVTEDIVIPSAGWRSLIGSIVWKFFTVSHMSVVVAFILLSLFIVEILLYKKYKLPHYLEYDIAILGGMMFMVLSKIAGIMTGSVI